MTAKNLILAVFSHEKIKTAHIQLIIPELAKEIGLEENIVLQQIHYWIQKCGKCIEDTLWIYNTFEQWHEQFKYWSISKIKRVFYSLEKQGFIKSKKLNSYKANHTKWYSINYEKIKEVFNKVLKQPSTKRTQEKRAIYSSEKSITKKNFASFKGELSSSQVDTIIKSKTDNNLHNNYLSLIKITDEPIKKTYDLKNHRQKTLLESEQIICQNMIETWDKVFIKNKKTVLLTTRRTEKLLKIWEEKFNQDIEQWKNFCISVNSSKFLMGEKKSDFKAYFDWIIEKETITKILAGEFGVGDRIPDIEQEAFEQNRHKTIKEHQAREEEIAKQRAKEEKSREIDKLAEKLMNEALHQLENSWTKEELEKAKNTFKSYVLANANEDKSLLSCKKLAEEYGWHSIFADVYFREFKLKHFLNSTFDWFREEAELYLNQ